MTPTPFAAGFAALAFQAIPGNMIIDEFGYMEFPRN
jgi:hypothetical protein